MKISQESWHYRFYRLLNDHMWLAEPFLDRPRSLCHYFWSWMLSPLWFVMSWTIIPIVAGCVLVVISPIMLCFYIGEKAPNKTKRIANGFKAIKSGICPIIKWEVKK